MEQLDEIIELLRDSQWHHMEDIKKNISLYENSSFNILINFLNEQGFIEIINEKIRLTYLGLKFLELPV